MFVLILVVCCMFIYGLNKLFDSFEPEDSKVSKVVKLSADYYWSNDKCDCLVDNEEELEIDEGYIQASNEDAGFNKL